MYGGLHENHAKEGVSFGYVSALIHYTGYTLSESRFDNGIDLHIHDIEQIEENGKIIIDPTSFSIDVQLKSTTKVNINDGFVTYSLDVKNYNQLIKTNISTPRILILYYFTTNRDQWLEVFNSTSQFNHYAWWVSLKGLPKSSNSSNKTIKIPLSQQLTRDSLRILMEKTKNGEDI